MNNRFIPREQIAKSGMQKILSSSQPGERIPSEEQLAIQFGVSRPTIRSVLSALEQEGRVIRKHGVGTFVNSVCIPMSASLQELYSVADIVRNNGYKPSVQHVHIENTVLPAQVCEALQLPKNEKGHRVVRTVFANQEPAVFLVDYLPTQIQQKTIDLSAFSDRMLRTLGQLGIIIAYAVADLSIQRTTAEAAAALAIPEGDTVLFLHQIAYTRENTPVIFSNGYHREGFVTYSMLRKVKASEVIDS